MNFTNRFKELMDRSDSSQTDLSKIVGFTPQTVSKWYNGKTEPDSKTIKKIANYFNVSTDYLLGNDKQLTKYEKELKELEVLKELLIKNGYMKSNEDLSKKELDNLMKFVKANKAFLKGGK